MANFFHELQRRNVIKAAISFAVISWAILQAAQYTLDVEEAGKYGVVIRYAGKGSLHFEVSGEDLTGAIPSSRYW